MKNTLKNKEKKLKLTTLGFTLIELLAVIIILAVIALIATPIVLNVVDKARDKANMQTVNGILDAGRLYYAESMLDSDKKLKVDNVSNIYSDVSLMNKPDNVKLPSGETYSNKLYVNNQGSIATSVMIDKKCYIKSFNSEVEIKEAIECDLGFIGKDEIYPTIEYSYSEITGTNEWYKEDMWITITAKDNESGISELKWCTTQSSTCDPIIKVIPKEDNKTLMHGINITTESATNNVCVSVIDVVGNITKGCSDKTIKLDKTSPSLESKTDVITITEGDSINASTYFNNPSYSISGGSMSCNPSNTSGLEIGSQTITCTATGGNGLTSSATKTITVKSKIDNSGASIPELTSKLIPIRYDGSNWIVADITSKWYDYTAKEWANAVVLNSGVSKTIGQTVAESEISLWYVWIPRYEYKLPSASIGTTGTPQAIDIKFIDKNKTIADSGYNLHPGFTFGGNNKNGIWIGKFEASTTVTTNGVQTIVTRPNVVSWRNVNVSNMFESSRNIESTYGITGMNSHMSKYTEWTAASYLTNSIYGRCGNATTCSEVTINSNSSYYTGGSNYKGNTTQSTTGNITGVYDMSGGAYEYVMGNYNNTISSAGFSSMPGSKYYDLFTGSNCNTYSCISTVNGSSSMNGVFKELMSTYTNNYNWYNDYAYSASSSNSWFRLGSNYNSGTYAGVFASHYGKGTSSSNHSFRVVLLAE